MSENPYESPQTEGESLTSSQEVPTESTAYDRELLRSLFLRQQSIWLAMLVQFAMLPLAHLLSTPLIEPLLLRLALVAVMLAGLIYCMSVVYRLAVLVDGAVAATVYALLMLVPLVSLLALSHVNQKVKAQLRRHGIEVGLFGTDYEEI